ncbi:hypothetical protein BJ878DRAFT_420424, partial [Calycina marina]
SPSAICSETGPEYGDFYINFDNLPPPPPPFPNTTAIHPPIFNPYHQLDWSAGFTVTKPPADAYKPSSAPLLLEFNATVDQPTGKISSGDHALTGCFNFNAYSGFFGCNSTHADCDFIFSGYQHDPIENTDTLIHTQTGSVSACPAQEACTLLPITLDMGFKNLTQLRINATSEGVSKTFWVDDLELGWNDNTCETGACRTNSHVPMFAYYTGGN